MEILGELLQNGLKNSNSSRVESSLGEKGVAAKGGVLEEILAGLTGQASSASQTPSGGVAMPKIPPTSTPARTGGAAASTAPATGGPLDMLKELAGKVLADPKMAGGAGALAGAILGGGGKSMKGAFQGGALALLGTLALQAFRNAQKSTGQQQPLDSASQLAAGLRVPETKEEERQVQAVADLTLKAMINAAKADGQIDDAEMQRIAGHLKTLKTDQREFLISELRKPMDTAALVRAVPNKQVAAQIYVASLLANGGDSAAEKSYLADLAGQLQLDKQVVKYLHTAVGMA